MNSPAEIPFAKSSSYPARPGNRVRPLVRGEEIFARIGEAVDAARHSIWVTIAFFRDDFRFPGGRGGLFDALDRAVARGVDVRLAIWRPDAGLDRMPTMFGGEPAQREWLESRRTRIKIRWDRAPGLHCQHQKSWTIDAGQPTETSFVGGANISASALRHQDIYVEVTGPAARDVRHNFVQRWNGATERDKPDGAWACGPSDDLPFPGPAASPCGKSLVQIARMLPAIGERSVVEQYCHAIDAAQRTIYAEHQAIPVMEVAAPLLRAAERGVEVILLVPTVPEQYVFKARLNPAERSRFEGVEALGKHPNFLMAGLGPETYVHAKVMVVDDRWATIGSCNLHAFSLQGHAELNAAIWDPEVAGAFRRKLFARHLGTDVSGLDDRSAFALYRQAAHEGRALQVLDPFRYGVT